MVTLIDNLDTSKSAAAKSASGSGERPRHPEKQNRPDSPVLRKPDWIRVRAPGSKVYQETRKIVQDNKLVTVCEEAGCPNIGECWSKKHATFMVMFQERTLTEKMDRQLTHRGAARTVTGLAAMLAHADRCDHFTGSRSR